MALDQYGPILNGQEKKVGSSGISAAGSGSGSPSLQFLSVHGNSDSTNNDAPGTSSGAAARETIFCETFKATCTRDDPDPNCQANVTTEALCTWEAGLKPSCYSVWRNSPEEGVKVVMKGCWQQQLSSSICRPNKCQAYSSDHVLKMPQQQPSDSYFCCCESSNCNRDMELLNFSTTPPPPVSNNDSLTNCKGSCSTISTLSCIFLPLLCVAVFCILMYFVFRCLRLHRKGVGEKLHRLPFTLQKPHINNNSHNRSLNYQIKEFIEKGRFAHVYRGLDETGQQVAIKKFLARDIDSWTQELDIFKAPLMTTCPNVLQFLSADGTADDPREYLLITTYHQNGSIYDYLKMHMITFQELLHITTTMLRGLAFLHEEKRDTQGQYKPVIVHRDFKSKNVLLKKDLTACVSDFGLALKFDNGRPSRETLCQVGTPRYMAPEVLDGATEFSAFAFKQIDVYAAALVIWELMSRSTGINAPVEEYCLPFEAEVGLDKKGSSKQMSEIVQEIKETVVVQGMRPLLKPAWYCDVASSLLCQTVAEMWDAEYEARLTAVGALERLLPLLDEPLVSALSDSTVSFCSSSSLSLSASAAAHNASLSASSMHRHDVTEAAPLIENEHVVTSSPLSLLPNGASIV